MLGEGSRGKLREDLALGSPGQTPGQEPVGLGPAPSPCGGGTRAAWALAQEDPGFGFRQDRAQPAWEGAGNEAAEGTRVQGLGFSSDPGPHHTSRKTGDKSHGRPEPQLSLLLKYPVFTQCSLLNGNRHYRHPLLYHDSSGCMGSPTTKVSVPRPWASHQRGHPWAGGPAD